MQVSKITFFTLFLAVSLSVTAENVVSRIQDGDVLDIATTNRDGKVEIVDRLHFVKRIPTILEAPIGSVYVPATTNELEELRAAVKPEIIHAVPAWRSDTAPQIWKRPRAVILERGTLKVKGFFSMSKVIETRRKAMEYLSEVIGSELNEFLGVKDAQIYPCGKAEFRIRHRKNRNQEQEIRFKCFSLDDGEKSVILVYHGFPRDDGSMDNEFQTIYYGVFKDQMSKDL